MLADNVGYGDIGAYGAGEVRGMPTPRIDSIAAQGLRLSQFFVEPGCTPSRAALMTGRYSQRAGIADQERNVGQGVSPLLDELKTAASTEFIEKGFK